MPDQETQEVSNAVQDAPQSPSQEQADIQELANALGVKVPQEAELKPQQETQEQVIEEVKPKIEEEHDLKSWMGRKLADQRKELETQFKGILDSIVERLPAREQQQIQVAPVEIEPIPGVDLDSPIITARDFLELQEKTQTARTQAEQNYWSAYGSQIGSMAAEEGLNPDQMKEIAEELDANMKNPITHKDPSVAAQINYLRAARNVLNRSLKKPVEKTIPGSGQHPSSATGIIVSQKTGTNTKPEIQLDAESERLRKAFNISDDVVKKVTNKK